MNTNYKTWPLRNLRARQERLINDLKSTCDVDDLDAIARQGENARWHQNKSEEFHTGSTSELWEVSSLIAEMERKIVYGASA